jgi:hypothetical protein
MALDRDRVQFLVAVLRREQPDADAHLFRSEHGLSPSVRGVPLRPSHLGRDAAHPYPITARMPGADGSLCDQAPGVG